MTRSGYDEAMIRVQEYAPPGMTLAQIRDAATLITKGGHLTSDAIRIVTKPKRRVTWRQPEERK